jgi:hypothetical protein
MLHVLFIAVLAGAPQSQGLEVRQQTLKSGVQVRSVVLTVRGKFGRKPRQFDESDFTILENGVAQPIAVFVKNSDDPKIVRYDIGYTITDDTPGQKKRVEIRVRGISKKMVTDFVTR